MPIPDYQSIMLPLLTLTSDNNEHILRDTIELLATQFNLTDGEREELLPSGTQAIFDNRVGWAKTHILKAGLLESPLWLFADSPADFHPRWLPIGFGIGRLFYR